MFKTKSSYILENDVYEFLTIFFAGHEIVREYKLEGSRHKCDFFIPSKNLIVEFDGPRHFTSPESVYSDLKKEKSVEDKGLNIIRIPYFMQLDTRLISVEFAKYHDNPDIEFNDFNNYLEGFIDTKIYPAQFCELGLRRFHKIMDDIGKKYDKMRQRIYDSLFNCLHKKNITTVFNFAEHRKMIEQFVIHNPEYYGYSSKRANELAAEFMMLDELFKK